MIFNERGDVAMMKRFQFYKNIILVVASALTLVAVTFAWFSKSYDASFDPIDAMVTGETISVAFYQMDDNGVYQPLEGDIELDDFVPGSYNKYKFEITTKTSDKLKFSFGIDNLPANMSSELKNSVCIKYKMYSCTKKTGTSGNVAYIDSVLLAHNDDYVPLSEFNDGLIINGLSLKNYQSSDADRFVIYYEIGLSEESSSAISGLESSLGDIRLTAQRIN